MCLAIESLLNKQLRLSKAGYGTAHTMELFSEWYHIYTKNYLSLRSDAKHQESSAFLYDLVNLTSYVLLRSG